MKPTRESADEGGKLSRREVLKAGAAVTAGLLLPSGCHLSRLRGETSKDATMAQNLVLFVTDDQSWWMTGYASEGRVQTPHLDRAARDGMMFTSAYCASMPCIPSRGCIMTGLHDHRWERQTRGMLEGLKEGSWTWAHALRERGYHTGLVGKMHFQPMRSKHGFDTAIYAENKLNWEWRGEGDYYDDHQRWLAGQGVFEIPREQPAGVHPDRIVNPIPDEAELFSWPLDPTLHAICFMRDRAIRFLEEQKRTGRPFCLLVSFKYPHGPFLPAPPYDRMYEPASFNPPTGRWKDMKNLPPALKKTVEELEGTWYGPSLESYGEEKYRRMMAAYCGLIAQVDDAMGAILEHVDLKDTTCLFTADHGDYLGRRNRMFKAPLIPLDDIARVPLVAWGAGVPCGTTCAAPVSLVDLAPTFLQSAGAPIPPDLDGRPLQEYFQRAASEPDRVVYCYGRDKMNMVRRGAWKYFRSHDGETELLFNLEDDPGEWNNVAGDSRHREVQRELAANLEAVLSRPSPTLPHYDADSRRLDDPA